MAYSDHRARGHCRDCSELPAILKEFPYKSPYSFYDSVDLRYIKFSKEPRLASASSHNPSPGQLVTNSITC
jgi:hypothetical protein